MVRAANSASQGKRVPKISQKLDWKVSMSLLASCARFQHISSKSPKPLFGALGQTEKTGFKVFGSFQPFFEIVVKFLQLHTVH